MYSNAMNSSSVVCENVDPVSGDWFSNPYGIVSFDNLASAFIQVVFAITQEVCCCDF